jgi:protein-S-isoprenylcysteine O-methyltransferase Ste14
MCAFLSTILVGGWLMFAESEHILNLLQAYGIKGDFSRRVILLCCSVAYLFRLFFTLFVFLRRKMTWTEAITISAIMPAVLFALLYIGGNKAQPVDLFDFLGLFLYLTGSCLNSGSEYSRHIWKQKPENRGRLYTEGLFKYSMHMNYFGDVVLFTGFAVITHSVAMLLIPFFMALNFAVIIIPSLDAHLAKKYGDQFHDYAKRTKKLVPLVY